MDPKRDKIIEQFHLPPVILLWLAKIPTHKFSSVTKLLGRGDYQSSDERYPHLSGDGNNRALRGSDNQRNDDQQSCSNSQDRPPRPRDGRGQDIQSYQNNNRDHRPSWRSSSADSQNQQSSPNQLSTGEGYEDNSGRPNYRPPPGNWNGRPLGPTPAYPSRGTGNCWICGQEGCHSRYHRDQPNAQPSNVATPPGEMDEVQDFSIMANLDVGYVGVRNTGHGSTMMEGR